MKSIQMAAVIIAALIAVLSRFDDLESVFV
jgi:hypothetical protein